MKAATGEETLDEDKSYPIKYALLEKVNIANGKVNFKRIMFQEIRNSLILYSAYIAIDSILGAIFTKEEGINWLYYLYWTLGTTGFRIGGKTIDQKWLDKKVLQQRACSTLEELSEKLGYNLTINTDLESLKKANVNKVKYKFDIKGFPPIVQHKYILIPSDDELQNIGNKCIHQEHRVLTRWYDISEYSGKTK